MSSIDLGSPTMSSAEYAITLGDLRHLVHLTGRDLKECVDLFGEDHHYTRTAIRLHAVLSALAADDKVTEGYRREVFLALGPAPEPGGAAREHILTEDVHERGCVHGDQHATASRGEVQSRPASLDLPRGGTKDPMDKSRFISQQEAAELLPGYRLIRVNVEELDQCFKPIPTRNQKTTEGDTRDEGGQ